MADRQQKMSPVDIAPSKFVCTYHVHMADGYAVILSEVAQDGPEAIDPEVLL